MRDDDEDPFDDFFREVERMMNDVMGEDVTDPSGFGSETHVDVQESAETIRVVADLPGLRKEDLSLKCDGDVLTISAATERREFDERVRLPARVDEHSARASFNNGVLDVTLEKSGDSADITLE
jgi:HSP20 family protein